MTDAPAADDRDLGDGLDPADLATTLRVLASMDQIDEEHPDYVAVRRATAAMSPAGGVGINLVIQDAVATARILGPVLRLGFPTVAALRRVQRRRSWPTRVTQFVQRRLQGPLLATRTPGTSLPLPLRLLRRFPALTRVTGRFIGLGVWPEKVSGR